MPIKYLRIETPGEADYIFEVQDTIRDFFFPTKCIGDIKVTEIPPERILPEGESCKTCKCEFCNDYARTP